MDMAEKEELSEEDLDEVGGGIFFAIIASCLASVGFTSFMKGWGKRHHKSRH